MLRRYRTLARRVGLALAAWSIAVVGASCSLTNISADSCETDEDCQAAFGLGSICNDGFCAESTGCNTGHDCRIQFGGGACVEGACTETLPEDPNGNCTLLEPANLAELQLVEDTSPIILGGIFRLEDTSEPARADAARLAIREINSVGGLNGERPLAMVICDNGGPGAAADDDERRTLTQQAVDYLAGTLGAPFIVGPNLSVDSLVAINYMLAQSYPTVLISPSSTTPALTNQPDRILPEDPFGLFWRTCPNDALQGRLLATLATNAQPTVTTVGAIYISDAYGEGLADTFQEEWGAADVSLFPYDADANFDTVIGNVENAAPDALLIIDVEAQRAVQLLTLIAASSTLETLPIFLSDGSKDEQVLLDPNLPVDVKNIIFTQVLGTAPAGPQTAASNVFFANYETEFGVNPEGNSFTANAYDAVYVGAAGVVHASFNTNNYDGRTVATGMSRLVEGNQVPVGALDWSTMKSELTLGNQQLDIEGISGPLDFDVTTGEADAPIEVWRPSDQAGDCNNSPPCFVQEMTLIP